MKKNIGFGMAAIGAVAALSALTVAVIKKKKDEEVYREAELKAMQELDDMIAENDKCEDCTCAEDCAACDAEEPDMEVEVMVEEAPAEETVEEEDPVEEAKEKPAE